MGVDIVNAVGTTSGSQNNGDITVFIPGAIRRQTRNSLDAQLLLTGVSNKFQERWDDPHYYDGDGVNILSHDYNNDFNGDFS